MKNKLENNLTGLMEKAIEKEFNRILGDKEGFWINAITEELCYRQRIIGKIKIEDGKIIKKFNLEKIPSNSYNSQNQSATFSNPEVQKSFEKLKAIIKKEKVDVMKLFAD